MCLLAPSFVSTMATEVWAVSKGGEMVERSGRTGVGAGVVDDNEVSVTKGREVRVGVGAVVDMREALSPWRGTVRERMATLGDY